MKLPAQNATKIPKLPFAIKLGEQRTVGVHQYIDESSSDFTGGDDDWDYTYLVTGVRHWTYNGEHIDEALLMALIRGSLGLYRDWVEFTPNEYKELEEE